MEDFTPVAHLIWLLVTVNSCLSLVQTIRQASPYSLIFQSMTLGRQDSEESITGTVVWEVALATLRLFLGSSLLPHLYFFLQDREAETVIR